VAANHNRREQRSDHQTRRATQQMSYSILKAGLCPTVDISINLDLQFLLEQGFSREHLELARFSGASISL
jgi:hypothetical protein